MTTTASNKSGKPRGRPQAAHGRRSAGEGTPSLPRPSSGHVRATKSIIEALSDPDLFGGMFDAASWAPWKAFLAALQALPMSEAQLALYRRHTGRLEPPTKAARYAELVVGRRGGKSRILALIATYLACVLDHSDFIVPGEVPVVAVIAKDRTQARVILGYIAGFVRSIALFAELIADELAESLHLSNGVAIEVHTASIAAPRGRTFLAVLADEIAFWPVGDSANPDVEVINAVRPGLSTIPYSLLLIASSPYAKRGVLYTNYAKYFGKDDAPVLVWQGTTEEMNSSLVGDPLIAEMYAEDHERALAEFGAQFRTDIVAFITREAIEDVIAHDKREWPPSDGVAYAAFVDPSGGSADSMTLAIGHCESSGLAVLDAVREVRPPFSPDAIVEEFSTLLKSYGISRVSSDYYGGEWPKERFASRGIALDVSTRNKSQIYGEFLPALNGQRVRLLDLPRLTGQLVGLERRTARGGRDSIDHAPGAHDDVANAVCGVLVNLIADRRPALVKQSDMLADGAAFPLPLKAAYLAAVLMVDAKGTAAVVYGAFGFPGQGPALFIADFDVGPMGGDLFASIAARLRELSVQCRVGGGAVVFVPSDLIVHAKAAGLYTEEIPPDYAPEERLLSVAAHVGAGKVRVCSTVLEKAKNSPFAGALDIRAGENAEDPLRGAAILLIALGLDDTLHRRKAS
jgi:hypothetical protein